MRNSLVSRMSRLQIAKSNPVRVIRTERICRPGFIKDTSDKFDGEKKHAGYSGGMAKPSRVNIVLPITQTITDFGIYNRNATYSDSGSYAMGGF